MNSIDLAIIIVLILFGLYGFRFGFVHAIGGIIGAVISFFIAAKLYLPFAASPAGFLLGGNTNVGKILAFTVLYVVIAKAIGIVIWVADKLFNIISGVPFISAANRVLGLIFGLVEGIVLLAGVVYISGKYPFLESFAVLLATSKIALGLNFFITLFEPLFPDWLASLRSVFDAPSGQAAEYIREYFHF